MKKYLMGLVTGIILTSIIGIAAYSYSAKDISYTPSDNNWNVHNVKSAIDSIKTTNDTTISSLQSEIETKTATITELSKYSECVSGSVVMNNDITTSTGQVIEDLFSPSMFFITEPNGVNTEIEFYVKDKNSSSIYSFCTANGGNSSSAGFSTFTLNQYYDISNNAFKIKNYPSSLVGKTMYYMACK